MLPDAPHPGPLLATGRAMFKWILALSLTGFAAQAQMLQAPLYPETILPDHIEVVCLSDVDFKITFLNQNLYPTAIIDKQDPSYGDALCPDYKADLLEQISNAREQKLTIPRAALSEYPHYPFRVSEPEHQAAALRVVKARVEEYALEHEKLRGPHHPRQKSLRQAKVELNTKQWPEDSPKADNLRQLIIFETDMINSEIELLSRKYMEWKAVFDWYAQPLIDQGMEI